ncbi:class II heat shock protein [Tanacetum coccineum]
MNTSHCLILPMIRLRIVGFNLEGAAAEWFQWMTRNGLITTYARFEESVKNRFGPSKYEDPKGALSKLLQLGTVEDYQWVFEKLMNKVTDIPDSLLISFYISGFKLNLQHELLLSRPTTLGDVFSLACIIEARFKAIAKKEKEQIVKKKTNVILALQSELASPKIKRSLNVDEDIGVDEVSSAIDGVFDLGESNGENMEVRSKFGDFSENKKSVEKVVGGGEALGVGEDDDSGNAATDGGDDAVESRDISILNSLNGHGSPRSSQLCGTIGTTDVQMLIDKGVDKEVQYYVYTLHVLISFLKRLNDKYIKKKKMKAAMQRRL